MTKRIIYKIMLFLTITVSCFADSPNIAKNIFVIPKFKSHKSGQSIQLVDAIQLRLRRKLKKYQISAYVFSPVEIEAYDSIDELIKSIKLKEGQKLFLIAGTFDITPARQAIAKMDVTGYVKGASYKIAEKTFTGNGARWKWHISRRVVSFIISDILSFVPPEKPKGPDIVWASSIVPNGGFEKGKFPYRPAHWAAIDNLCSFWIKSDKRGKCIKFDTNVNQEQAWDWWKALKQGADLKDAPEPIHTDPPHYDAVGGIEGVKLYSDYITVRPGIKYRLCAKIKGPIKGQAKIFVKAYAMLPTAKSDKLIRREVWNMYMHCDTNGGDWREYSEIFTLPKKLTPVRKKYPDGKVKYYVPEIKWVRVMLYAYWKVGEYYFDDVKICPAVVKTSENVKKE